MKNILTSFLLLIFASNCTTNEFADTERHFVTDKDLRNWR